MDDVDTLTNLSSPIMPSHPGAKSAFWKRHVEAWQSSELSQRAYAKHHQLSSTSFAYWKRKLALNQGGSKSTFVSVKVATVTATPVRLTHPNGFMIECQAGTDVTWLQALMGGKSCVLIRSYPKSFYIVCLSTSANPLMASQPLSSWTCNKALSLNTFMFLSTGDVTA